MKMFNSQNNSIIKTFFFLERKTVEISRDVETLQLKKNTKNTPNLLKTLNKK